MFNVERVRLRHSGKSGVFERIVGPDSVCVVAISNRKLILEKHYRWTMDKSIYELPAGYVGNGEKPEDAAKRELLEETSYDARNIRFLFNSYCSPGSKTELTSFYAATKLVKSFACRDREEMIRLRHVSMGTALGMIRRNKIVDQKSIAGILFYTRFKSR
jgi:ADP-ribose pyrophosphatase